jgi:hypothetical protein
VVLVTPIRDLGNYNDSCLTLNLSYLLKLPDFLFIVADSLHICDV